MIYNELPTVFPWYEKVEQQDRFRENVEKACDYKLITPRDALLPFQFVRDSGGIMPNLWEIFEANSQVKVADITASLSFLRVRLIEGNEYYTGDGRQLTTGGSGILNLPPGFYYSRLSWPDGTLRYSEMFFVPDTDKNFQIANDATAEFLKLEWWNDNDIRPLFYNDKQTSGRPFFRNVLYLDSFVTASEPEIVEDGEKDGNDEVIPTFQKAIIKYRITSAVSDYVKKAMSLLNMHDHAILTTHRSVRTGEMDKINITTTFEANGAISIVDLVWQETLLLKKGCGENMTSDCAGSAPGLNNPIGVSGSDYILSGTAPAGSSVIFYRLNSPTDLPTIQVGITYSNTQFATGITIPAAQFFASLYVVAKAFKFGCDFGYSNVVQKPI